MRGVALQPLGDVDRRALPRLALDLATTFGQPCRVLAAQPMPQGAFDQDRGQYLAAAVLDCLRRGRPAQSARVLALVDVDLYAEGLNFVFGQAEMPGRVAVVSLYRLKAGGREDVEAMYLRTLKESVHELGHTFGLAHCRNDECVMRFSNSLADTDYKSVHFCSSCRVALRRF